MQIKQIISFLETLAPPALQESYDNAQLLTGNNEVKCTGVLCTLDATEEVVYEAIKNNCNLIVAHHPIVFSGLKSLTGKNYIERTVIAAIKNDIAIYAIHTNLDNVLYSGVNTKIAEMLRLQNLKILQPKKGNLKKLYTYAPKEMVSKIQKALYASGAGEIGLYANCSFITDGIGSFTPLLGANPHIGQVGQSKVGPEQKIEVIFEAWKQENVLNALRTAHEYEEIAYEVITLDNVNQTTGSGIIGTLQNEVTEAEMLQILKTTFYQKAIKHTPLLGKKVKKIAICGGAGSFLTKTAIAKGADMFITADVKYHEFFDADGKIVLADIGHFESEQYTIRLLSDVLSQKFPNFAVLASRTVTNPVQIYL
jgi:dinuclear metal center YbgI/SA1388 family protein